MSGKDHLTRKKDPRKLGRGVSIELLEVSMSLRDLNFQTPSVSPGFISANGTIYSQGVTEQANDQVSVGFLGPATSLFSQTVTEQPNDSVSVSFIPANSSIFSQTVTEQPNNSVSPGFISAATVLFPQDVSEQSNDSVSAGHIPAQGTIYSQGVSEQSNDQVSVGFIPANGAIYPQTVEESLEQSVAPGFIAANGSIFPQTVTEQSNDSVSVGFLAASGNINPQGVANQSNDSVSLGFIGALGSIFPQTVSEQANDTVSPAHLAAAGAIYPQAATQQASDSVSAGHIAALGTIYSQTVTEQSSGTVSVSFIPANGTIYPQTVSEQSNDSVSPGFIPANGAIYPQTVSEEAGAEYVYEDVVLCNCGKTSGALFNDSLGRDWSNDFGFTGGAVFDDEGAGISDTLDDPMYEFERYFNSSAGSNANRRYDFSGLNNGTHRVRLHFSEIWLTSAGERVFDVIVNGVLVADNLDIYAEVGGFAAYVVEVETEVVAGTIAIEFPKITDNPAIKGIEIAEKIPAMLSGMVAWYDFDDNTDSHGTYPLTEVNSPVYASGYGVSDSVSNDHWTISNLSLDFAGSEQDWAIAIRFRARSTVPYILLGNSGRTGIRFRSFNGGGFSEIRGEIGNIQLNSVSSDLTLDEWRNIVVMYESATNTVHIYIGGTLDSSLTGTPDWNTGLFRVCGNNDTTTSDIDMAYMGLWGRLLTQSEITSLNSDKEYSQLNV